MNIPWTQIEALIHRDPGNRGICSANLSGEFLDHGQLQIASAEISANCRRAAIVTGFYILDAAPPAGETDGPPGALYLAKVLLGLGIQVDLVCDHQSAPLLFAGISHWKLDVPNLRLCITEPHISADSALGSSEQSLEIEKWCDEILAPDAKSPVTHLIAIERCGPAHTIDSIQAQDRSSPGQIEEFRQSVPVLHQNRCHNMRGKIIDAVNPPLHVLFERASQLKITTLGIGDGGNEIGMGKLPWRVIRDRLAPEQSSMRISTKPISTETQSGQSESIQPSKSDVAAWIPCRIATDYLIVAGVSNWGGYALAAGVAAVANRLDVIREMTPEAQQDLIRHLVEQAGAVDGVTRTRQVSVDGLSMTAYLECLREIRSLLGIQSGDPLR